MYIELTVQSVINNSVDLLIWYKSHYWVMDNSFITYENGTKDNILQFWINSWKQELLNMIKEMLF